MYFCICILYIRLYVYKYIYICRYILFHTSFPKKTQLQANSRCSFTIPIPPRDLISQGREALQSWWPWYIHPGRQGLAQMETSKTRKSPKESEAKFWLLGWGFGFWLRCCNLVMSFWCQYATGTPISIVFLLGTSFAEVDDWGCNLFLTIARDYRNSWRRQHSICFLAVKQVCAGMETEIDRFPDNHPLRKSNDMQWDQHDSTQTIPSIATNLQAEPITTRISLPLHGLPRTSAPLTEEQSQLKIVWWSYPPTWSTCVPIAFDKLVKLSRNSHRHGHHDHLLNCSFT